MILRIFPGAIVKARLFSLKPPVHEIGFNEAIVNPFEQAIDFVKQEKTHFSKLFSLPVHELRAIKRPFAIVNLVCLKHFIKMDNWWFQH